MEKNKRIHFDEGKLRSLLFQRKLTQTQLAENIGINKNYLNTVIIKGSCSYKLLDKICKGLDIKPVDLII